MKKYMIILLSLLIFIIPFTYADSLNISYTTAKARSSNSALPDTSTGQILLDDTPSSIKRGYLMFQYYNSSVLDEAYIYMMNEYINSPEDIVFYYCYDGIWESNPTWNNQDTIITDCHYITQVANNYFTPTFSYIKVNTSIHEYINNDTDKNFTIKIKHEFENSSGGSGAFSNNEFVEIFYNGTETIPPTNETGTPSGNFTQEYDIVINFDNTNKYVFFVILIFISLLFVSFKLVDGEAKTIMIIFTALFGIFSSIWIIKSVPSFPSSVSLIYFIVSLYLLIISFYTKET